MISTTSNSSKETVTTIKLSSEYQETCMQAKHFIFVYILDLYHSYDTRRQKKTWSHVKDKFQSFSCFFLIAYLDIVCIFYF